MRRRTVYGQTIRTTSTTTGAISKEFIKYVEDLEAMVRRIKALDGSHVLFAHTVTGGIGAGSLSFIVDSGVVERAITPAMHLSPAAFKDNIAGGRMLPDKKRAVIANLAREQAAQSAAAMQSHKKLITNRKDFIEIYFEELRIYPPSKMGKFLNRSTQQAIR